MLCACMLSSFAFAASTPAAPIVMLSSAAATPAPKPIDLVHLQPIASSSASSILTQLAAEAAKIESDFEGEAAGVCDVYGKGRWIDDFQAQVAADLGKEASLFMPTGVCAQMAALSVYAGLPLASRSLLRPSFITHATSHLLVAEENAYSDLLGITAIKAGDDGRPLTAADVEVELKRLAAVGLTPCCIVIEMPWRELGCRATPWDELLALRKLADKCGTTLQSRLQPPVQEAATRCTQAATQGEGGCGSRPQPRVLQVRHAAAHGRREAARDRAVVRPRPGGDRGALRLGTPLLVLGAGLSSGVVGNPHLSPFTLTLSLARSTSPCTRGWA